MKGLKVALLGLWLLALAAGTLASAEEAAKKTLSISVGDWPPYLEQSAPGQGSLARLIRDVFAEEGYAVKFHFRPWSRAYREAAQGEHDATAVWMFERHRTKDFLYSAPVLNEQFVLFYSKDNPIAWSELKDLSDLRLGGTRGYSYGPDFDRAVSDHLLTIDWVSYSKLNFGRLLYDRIDAFPEEKNVGYHILKREFSPGQVSRITHHPKPILENRSFVLFPSRLPQSQALMERFNERLQMFRESGRYDSYFSIDD